MDDAFGAAVEPRGATLVKRRNLRDSHNESSMLHPLRRLFGVSGKHASPPLVTGIDWWSPQQSMIKNQTGRSRVVSAYPRTTSEPARNG